MIIISDRLRSIAEMVSPCGVATDVGCDHCLTLMYLLENGLCKRGIGADIKPGPLESARANIIEFGFEPLIELRLGFGLSTIEPGEADAIVISGMGGITINSILTEGLRVAREAAQLILQPQSDITAVRKCLHSLGFEITAENMVTDSGKYYNIIQAAPVPTGISLMVYDDERDYIFGKCLIDGKSAVFKRYLEKRRGKNMEVLRVLTHSTKEKSVTRVGELERDNLLIDETLENYDC